MNCVTRIRFWFDINQMFAFHFWHGSFLLVLTYTPQTNEPDNDTHYLQFRWDWEESTVMVWRRGDSTLSRRYSIFKIWILRVGFEHHSNINIQLNFVYFSSSNSLYSRFVTNRMECYECAYLIKSFHSICRIHGLDTFEFSYTQIPLCSCVHIFDFSFTNLRSVWCAPIRSSKIFVV